MNTIAEKASNALHTIPQKVLANEIESILDNCNKNIKVLSLDCFDTLLWRKTSMPGDVFYDMQQRLPFQLRQIVSVQRTTAESNARHQMFVKYGTYEVKLKDIYSLGFPNFTKKQLSN